MLSSLFSKTDLLKTFVPLSETGKAYLEIMLVNAKTSKPEGRGFFNDADFLLEACRGLVGRYNFCLSNFAYTQAQIPTRASYNQFDRTLGEFPGQDQARVHSITMAMLFKPDLIHEMSLQIGNGGNGSNGGQFLNISYQIDAILGRLGIKSYSLDYFLTGAVVRLWAPAALQRRPLNKGTLVQSTRKLLEVLEKKMTPQEQKHFALTASVFGKMHDPAPGLPGMFSGDAPDSMVVSSSGSLEPGEETVISALFEEVFEAKKSKVDKETYVASANIQGLSQNWQETQEPQYESAPSPGLHHEKNYSSDKGGYQDMQPREGMRELVTWFQNYTQGKWRWPLYSAAFNKIHQGAGCGEMMLLQCDPFASELGFQFLMQCAEGFAKEGTGQVLIFSKKRSIGDLAMSSLSRHYRGNPLAGKPPGGTPEAAVLAKAFDALFPNPLQLAPCGRGDGLDQLLKYLEHDYLPKQRKRGNALMPLAIVIDNVDEFAGENRAETFRGLSQMKMRLREFNGSLWVTRMGTAAECAADECVSLADYLLVLDNDGSREGSAKGAEAHSRARLPKASEWEAGFHVDLSVAKIMQEISLAKIHFQAHGSHRHFQGHYVYHRPSFLFKEINPAPQGAAHAPPGASVSQGLQPG
ncbi:MAG: hypothetical protein JWP91_4547 [Fibrobacteres bacterium]|nr:hypothetical protein [Fibrobacterota bacterium]